MTEEQVVRQKYAKLFSCFELDWNQYLLMRQMEREELDQLRQEREQRRQRRREQLNGLRQFFGFKTKTHE